MLKIIKKFIPRSQYARNVTTLMAGTGIAQVIPIAVSPLLTRLYSPAEFGQFALYLVITSVVSVAITGRYELAILLPKRDRDALHILALAVALSIVLSAVFLVLASVFHRPLAVLFGDSVSLNWPYWVAVSILLTGLYQSLSYWCNRKSMYRCVAVNRALQGGGASFAQLGGGYVGVGIFGLIGGQMLGQILSTFRLAQAVWRGESGAIRQVDWRRIVVLAKRYANFPRFLIAAHGFNTLSAHMPVLLIGSLYGVSIAGFYMLTQRVLAVPMALVAGAVSDVFRQEASQSFIHFGNCLEVYQKTFRRLLWISVGPFVLLFLAAPAFFALIFGEQWRVAGEYARILAPVFFLQFVTSPLSAMFMIAQKQKLDLVWQVCLVSSTSVSFLFGYLLGSVEWALALFAASYSLMYVTNGLMTYKFAHGGT